MSIAAENQADRQATEIEIDSIERLDASREYLTDHPEELSQPVENSCSPSLAARDEVADEFTCKYDPSPEAMALSRELVTPESTLTISSTPVAAAAAPVADTPAAATSAQVDPEAPDLSGVNAFAVHGPLAGIVLQYPPEVMEEHMAWVLAQGEAIQRDWGCPVMVLPATAGAAFAGVVRKTTVEELEKLKPLADERLAQLEVEARNRRRQQQTEALRRQKLIKRSRKLTRRLGLKGFSAG